MKIQGLLSGGQWQEETRFERDGVRWTQLHERWTLEGGFVGDGEVVYQVVYQRCGAVRFHGQERLTGVAQGIQGSLLLQTQGCVDEDGALGRWEVLEGTDGFRGVTGSGEYYMEANSHNPALFELTLENL